MTRGRPRAFDLEQAIDAATQVFWKYGYEGASCEHLLTAMQMKPGSMYAAFGDKSSLYQLCLERYAEKSYARLLEILDRELEPLARIRCLIETVGQFLSEPDCRGCLVNNVLLESATSGEVSAIAATAVQRLEDKIHRTLQEAVDAGQWPWQASPQAVSALIISAIQGMNVLVRSRLGERRIPGTVDALLEFLGRELPLSATSP